jgi:2-keto-4-pentenoate hydratase/2-oxohepta-3-ene-1,7-dioic acid hydratase in catechol pathway
MKLTFINNYQLAAVTEQGVVDLGEVIADLAILPPQQKINHVIEHWSDYRAEFERVIATAQATALDDVTLQAPLPKPTSIVCMAVNYMENGLLKEKPAAQAFFKNSHSVIGDNATMHLPDVPASIFEGEAEVALVIGKKATNVAPEDAYEYIFGYLNFVDGSARGLATGMGLSYFMKGQDDFAPMGPWITTADEIDNPMNLHVQQWNNGKVTHDYNTDDMAHDIAASVAFVSSNTTLEPGDVIALGTNHQGLHPLQDGDVVEQETDGLGRLTFHVRDELKRTWGRSTRAEWRSSGGEGGNTPQLSGKYA